MSVPFKSLREWLRRARWAAGPGRVLYDLERINFRSGLRDSAWVLHGLARTLKPEVCVEIGSARGKSACYIAAALEHNRKGVLYAVDPHTATDWNDAQSIETLPIMRENLAALRLEHRVRIIRQPSQEAALGWNRPIDLLFIDGDHSYEGVKRDWRLFSPHLSRFGVAVFHDTAWEVDPVARRDLSRDDMGVPRFVDELRREGRPVITLPLDRGVSIVQTAIGGVRLHTGDAETPLTPGSLRRSA